MLASVLLVIHLVVAIALVAIILLQPSEAGGFLGSGGSMSNMLAPRRSEDLLTRLTKILAGLFFATSLLLAVLASQRPEHKSILDVATDQASPAATQQQTAPPATPEAPVTK